MPWSSRAGGLAGVALYGLITGLAVKFRGGRVAVSGPDGAALLAFLLLGLFWVWVVTSQPLALWSRINGSRERLLRHLQFVSSVREQGGLRFGEPSYPGAVHALGAWLTAALDLAS